MGASGLRNWLARARSVPSRWALWLALVALVVALLGLLVWLAGRFEASQWQERLERDTQEAASDVRIALTRDVQTLQSLNAVPSNSVAWQGMATSLLIEHRHLLRLESRSESLTLNAYADSPYRATDPWLESRTQMPSEAQAACATARRLSAPAYGTSYFVRHLGGVGLEVLDMCLALSNHGKSTGYIVAVYGLQSVLAELVSKQNAVHSALSFTEADGTRLAMQGMPPKGDLRFSATQLLDLPGNTLVLRMDRGRAAPDVFPNVLTALVTALSITLITVLVLLGRDMRRRQRAEGDLAQALAFRKAMEDSLITGLRARDLQGRITYVNPAFCAMVGYSSTELMGTTNPAPYWPAELVEEYKQRQIARFASNTSTREGFETLFQPKTGPRITALVIEAPLIDAKGQQTGWMSAVLDVSAQRKAEEMARASQERLAATARLATVGEMASLISHELNQPLAAISSYAAGAINMIAMEGRECSTNAQFPHQNPLTDPNHGQNEAPALDLAQFRQALQRIAQQAERAGKVIKSVNDVVRRQSREREAVMPQALFDAVLPLVELQSRKGGVRLRTVVPVGLEAVLCDRTLVEQVLLNLARNGVQAMANNTLAPRELTLAVRKAASNATSRWLEFSVTDTGAGIDQTVAKQLFTAFFTTRSDGMGLGLSLCRTVVEQHGGALEFRPNTPQGTVFVFTLPASMAKAGESQLGGHP